jgi:hypothetical protein
VLSEHGIKFASSIYYIRRRPVTIAELAKAHLVNALVDRLPNHVAEGACVRGILLLRFGAPACVPKRVAADSLGQTRFPSVVAMPQADPPVGTHATISGREETLADPD